MSFEDVWGQVQGLPDTAKMQVPGTLREETKKRLEKKTPAEIGRIVAEAIEEVNNGSVEPLDRLIKNRL